MKKWNIFYDNDVGPNDDYFIEWFEVMDSESQYDEKSTKVFRCDSRQDAEWLAGILNDHEIKNPLT